MAKKSRVGKTDLVGYVAVAAELTKEKAKNVVNAVLAGIFSVLKDAGKLQLTNFGTFTVKQTKERQGINPKTQEPITIPASYRLGFKACKAWKEGMMPRKREQAKGKGKAPVAKAAPKAKGKR